MSILPMKKCKTCDYIFKSTHVGRKTVCPRCGGKSLTEASALDIAYDKKLKAQEKNK